jgi:(+)-trans-carveol dehydrogenase
MNRLEGKIAFVTGAARGQGRAEALRFAEEGADIIALDICRDVEGVPYPGSRPEDLEETVRLVEAHDRRIVARQADVRDFEAVSAAVDAGVDELGGLDIVMANAGIVSFGQADELDEQQWDAMIAVNLSGVWKTVKAAIPHLKQRGAGSIIITSSTAGFIGPPNVAHYNAAKHGVIGLMKTLANELAPHNIRANCVCPTGVATAMALNQATYNLFRPDLEAPTEEDFREAAKTIQLLAVPLVEPVDIANAALFLASEEARYVTGHSLLVDAGSLAKAS